MATLIPTASACHTLQLPPIEKDDRLNLNVRTGSASTLYNSLVFTFGGLTIGLELNDLSISEILDTFMSKISNLKSKKIDKYLSGELFYLTLIERFWTRVIIPSNAPRPRPRLLHEVCAINNCVYLFGGLIVPDEVKDEEINDSNDYLKYLVPCNDLWEFNLQTSQWTLLHDGSNHENDPAIPKPRYSHKLTTISSLTFVNKTDHFGIFIAGGKDSKSKPIYENSMFDLVEKNYVGSKPIILRATTGDKSKDEMIGLSNVANTDEDSNLHVDYSNSVIVSFTDEIDYHYQSPSRNKHDDNHSKTEESVIVFAPTKNKTQDELTSNPLVSFKIGKSIKHGKTLPIHRKSILDASSKYIEKKKTTHTIPFNLRYPTGGLFGQNIVITGFLPNDFDISIFIYNKPTGKWSRLNIFCNHDYGSHRFWGGFAWQSHHKVVLIGNFLTSRTTSSTRYFTLMITVSLPITNILVSSELEGGHYHDPDGKRIFNKDDSSDESSFRITDAEVSTSPDILSEKEEKEKAEREIFMKQSSRRISTVSQSSDKSPNTISFNEYVHYVAPKSNFTTVRSVFPPAAVTLGRNAFDRYGDLISDFELVSSNGDRIPVSLSVLMERWGRYFIRLLARGYVKAVDKFEAEQESDHESQRLRTSKSSTSSSNSNRNKLKASGSTFSGSSVSSDNDQSKERSAFHISIPVPTSKTQLKEPPQFRLPFQEQVKMLDEANSSQFPPSDISPTNQKSNFVPIPSANDPHQTHSSRKDSIGSFSSGNSLLASHLQDIPPQLPLPIEPIPAVPAAPTSFRSSSRKNSNDISSPRASLIHTLTALRRIPASRSPRDSPFTSPRASLSAQGGGIVDTNPELSSSQIPNLRPGFDRADRSKSFQHLPNDSNDSISSNIEVNGKNTKVPSSSSITSIESQDKEKKFPSLSTQSESLSTSIGEFDASIKAHDNNLFDNALLNFEDIGSGRFMMEPSLIPRKLYMPFSTATLKAFCEYLYTGQVGNKWLLSPTALDNLAIAKFLKVPLLYDLISEVLFGIIGRKESYVIKVGNKLKRKYFELLELTNTPLDPNFKFPLDEYEGFMDTVDDGYLDIALLKKSSKIHKNSSVVSSKKKKSLASSGHSSLNGLKEEANEDSTDDSSDKKTSEEENDFELGFLDAHDNTKVGPRSKSVFDKTNSMNDDFFQSWYDEANNEMEDEKIKILTLEELVSPESEIPTDYAIDLIYESGAITTDMKLMLRAANARQMSRILNQTQFDIGVEIEKLSKKYEEQHALKAAKVEAVESATSIKPCPSSSSLTTISTVSNLKNNANLEMTRSNTSFRAISSLTPFKQSKSDLKLDNKELDKRITKLIKKDEKLKSKHEKDQKLKRQNVEKLQRKQLEKAKKDASKNDAKKPRHYSILSRSTSKLSEGSYSPPTSINSTNAKKHHGLFHHIGYHKKKDVFMTEDDSSVESSKVGRTQSSGASISSATSKKSESTISKKKYGLFGIKKTSN